MYKWMKIKASVPSSRERRICILSLWVAQDEKSFSFLLALLLLDYYIFFRSGCEKGEKRKSRKEMKKLAKPFRWQAASEDVEIFLLSNQCVAWYMSDIIAFKNIIFSLNVKWMSVQARHEYRRAWDEGMAAGISFVEICAKMGNKKHRRRAFTLLNCFYFIPSTEKHTPCHHMMYVEKSPFSGNERWHNVCHTYETYFRVNNLKLNPLTFVAGWESADPGGTTLPQYIICDNWMRFER